MSHKIVASPNREWNLFRASVIQSAADAGHLRRLRQVGLQLSGPRSRNELLRTSESDDIRRATRHPNVGLKVSRRGAQADQQ